MTKWKMRSHDFYEILRDIQDYKCYYTGWQLTPENTSIAHRINLKDGGKHMKENVILVHRSIANLARERSEGDLLKVCSAVTENKLDGN